MKIFQNPKTFFIDINNLKQILYANVNIVIHSIEEEDPNMNICEIWNDSKKKITMMKPTEI